VKLQVIFIAMFLCVRAGSAVAVADKESTAEERKALHEKIDRLVKQLGDDAFPKREQARKELEKIGEPAMEILRKASETADDAEVRDAANKLLNAIEPTLPLDLTPAYQTLAAQFAKPQKFPWPAVPRGSKTFGNIPLAIDGRICLWGATNAKLGLVFPEKAKDIPVRRKFSALYVYHAAFIISPDESPIYHVILDYADGTSSKTTICYGTHVRDWHRFRGEAVSELGDPNSKAVWTGDHPDAANVKLRFFITTIVNPSPRIEVKSIGLASAKGNSAGCILAMTTGPDKLLKVDAPKDK
jgi:hypothetical protein